MRKVIILAWILVAACLAQRTSAQDLSEQCARKGVVCITPGLSAWKYEGFDTLQQEVDDHLLVLRGYMQGSCPITYNVRPFDGNKYGILPYGRQLIGDGYTWKFVDMSQSSSIYNLSSPDNVMATAHTTCNMEFNYAWEKNTNWTVLLRNRELTCPSGYELRSPALGGTTCYGERRKIVVLDPGHGFDCKESKVGAIGRTDFPANDPPPGRLHEDNLTFSIAQQSAALLSSRYTVIMTKKDARACPTLKERGRIANKAGADVFVSIHINAGNVISPFGYGTSALYNVEKRPLSSQLAELASTHVSRRLGTNNRGSVADAEIAVLKPTVTDMTAVLVEVARLSGSDEKILHSAGSDTKAANGISDALQAYFGK